MVYNDDCVVGLEKLFKEKGEFVDICITSPPYNLNIEYGTYEDNLTYEKYIDFTEKWIRAVEKVMINSGRICVNIPFEINNGTGKNFAVNDYINVMNKIGLKQMAYIIWDKNNVTSRTAWGSYQSPSCPNIINPFECILVYAKGDRKKQGLKSNIDITGKQFVDWSLGYWEIAAESAKLIGHPAPFPEKLPERLLKMFSYVGDTCLDPFSGSGTTAVACINNKRNFVGFEIDQRFFEASQKRIDNIENQLCLF